jgi:hypothetical protein
MLVGFFIWEFEKKDSNFAWKQPPQGIVDITENFNNFVDEIT